MFKRPSQKLYRIKNLYEVETTFYLKANSLNEAIDKVSNKDVVFEKYTIKPTTEYLQFKKTIEKGLVESV
jgi:hypothetical protein